MEHTYIATLEFLFYDGVGVGLSGSSGSSGSSLQIVALIDISSQFAKSKLRVKFNKPYAET